MRVTDDEYELPIAFADTMAELAMMLGCSRNTVKSGIQRARYGIIKHSTWQEVDIGDDDS